MKAARQRRVKAAARAIQDEAQKLRKPRVPLLEVVQESQGHLTDIQGQATDQYHEEALATEIAEGIATEEEPFKDSPFPKAAATFGGVMIGQSNSKASSKPPTVSAKARSSPSLSVANLTAIFVISRITG